MAAARSGCTTGAGRKLALVEGSPGLDALDLLETPHDLRFGTRGEPGQEVREFAGATVGSTGRALYVNSQTSCRYCFAI